MRGQMLFLACLAVVSQQQPLSPDEYFQTVPELYAAPTGEAPFLAEINPAEFPSKSYIPVSPLTTQAPVAGHPETENIFQLHGELSHYFPNPDGFGVDEHPLPPGANVTYLYMLSRHGSRYPTTRSGAPTLGAKLVNASGTFNATGDLTFLNSWTYKLGTEILVPVGKQELFDSGTLHYHQYAHLLPKNGSKIIARSTTQDRMTQSAEYFLAGFFGPDWTKNATLELIIEGPNFNNSLAGYFQCPNSNTGVSAGGNNASAEWTSIYLANATQRLQSQIQGFNWTATDTHNAQSLCAYETAALGFSKFCGLFTYNEWLGYEYSVDLAFAGNNAFQSPTGRAVGVGWVQELLARLQHRTINTPTAQVNVTLDNNTSTFPINQRLNFDFSHDSNIMFVLTAFGLTQFAGFLPPTKMVPRDLIVSHMTPFGARLDIEVIEAPQPVASNRSTGSSNYEKGGKTQYIRFVLNQRTIPLGKSFSECGTRDDGWCELSTFLSVQARSLEVADYEYACFGNYPPVAYGKITNGVPLRL